MFGFKSFMHLEKTSKCKALYCVCKAVITESRGSGRLDNKFFHLTVRINRINVCEEHFVVVWAPLVVTMKRTVNGEIH